MNLSNINNRETSCDAVLTKPAKRVTNRPSDAPNLTAILNNSMTLGKNEAIGSFKRGKSSLAEQKSYLGSNRESGSSPLRRLSTDHDRYKME